MLEKDVIPNWGEEEGGFSALHEAAFFGHTNVVENLIDAGWDLELKSFSGHTPLHNAAMGGKRETVMLLLLKGAKIDTQIHIKWTALHGAAYHGHIDVIQCLLMCGASQGILNDKDEQPLGLAKNEETRSCLQKFHWIGNLTQHSLPSGDYFLLTHLLQYAIEHEKSDVAAYLIFKGAIFEPGNWNLQLNTLLEILDLAAKYQHLTSLKNIINHLHQNKSFYNNNNIMHHAVKINSLNVLNESLIFSNIDDKNAEGNTPLHVAIKLKYNEIVKFLVRNDAQLDSKDKDGNTSLHLAASSNNLEIVKYLLENGASPTQFVKNKNDKTPLKMAKTNTDVFQIIFIDFLNFSLKTSKFASDEFQNQLGSGPDMFCLKKDFNEKTLLEFLNEKDLFKEREEMIQLLIKIDKFRYPGDSDGKGKKRIIRILRSGMKSSSGLKESIDSVKNKYPSSKFKTVLLCAKSVLWNIIFGFFFYISDVASDLKFYTDLLLLGDQAKEARIATMVHIILPFAFAILTFLMLLWSNFDNLKKDWYLVFRFPLPPVTKFHKTVIECRSYVNDMRKGEADYDEKKTKLIKELEDQKIVTTIAMILEAGLEASFQFLFQGLYSLPTLIVAFMDVGGINNLTDLVNWKVVSIVFSFLSFAQTSFNIRCVNK